MIYSYNSLPYEITSLIFTFMTPETINNYQLSNKKHYKITLDPTNRAQMLIKYYGKGQALYKSYTFHQKLLTVSVASIMLKNGSLFPRFLAQLSVQDVPYKLI